MPNIDMPLAELRTYQPSTREPEDFAAFWEGVVTVARRPSLDIELTPCGPPMAGVEAARLVFSGLEGGRVTGWYVRPTGEGPFPGLAHYHGYSGRAARPLDLYPLAAQGIAVLSMDCRGQGGEAPDIPAVDGGHYAGWLTRGLADPATHYYRYVFADAVLALDVLASFPEVDAGRLATTGVSQGGGLSLAAAALSGRASFVWSDIPFLCDYRRAVDITPTLPYREVSTYLSLHPRLEETAFSTLDYFDMANHARQISCPVTVTVGLWDDVCPPSTVFGMFSRLPNPDKDLMVLSYTGHEIFYDVAERRFSEIVRRLGAGGGAAR